MKFSILTLFPDLLTPYLNTSILGRAASLKGKVEYELLNIRDFATDKHQVVDGRPFGGGAGMVLKADILAKTWQEAAKRSSAKPFTILTSPSGTPYKQETATKLLGHQHLIIVCGRYEGVDQRFIDQFVDAEVSIGDYVVTGGELPALIIIDSIVRLIPGVLEKEESAINESFTNNLLEYPQYTRPAEFDGKKVPEVLLSGNHQEVAKWREAESLKKTQAIRPDLIKKQ